jgi:uncharacterized membrane protein
VSEDESAGASRDAYHPPWERRGVDLNRVLSLSDGIFGFAMTLLVLSIVLPVVNSPSDCTTLQCQLTTRQFQSALAAFAFVFVVLASYWRSHNLMFTFLRGWDQLVIQLNFLFLALIVLQPFLVHVLTAYDYRQPPVQLYSLICGATGLTLAAIWLHAMRDRTLLHPGMTTQEALWMRNTLLLTPAIFLAAYLVAFWRADVATLVWLSVIVVQAIRSRKAQVLSRSGGSAYGAAPADGAATSTHP